MEPAALARQYYEALDDHDYESLAAVLDPDFVQDRPDLMLTGRDRFVRFMREERPDRQTTHVVDGVYTDETDAVAVEGRLLDADDAPITTFVDVFSIDDGRIRRLRTYTC